MKRLVAYTGLQLENTDVILSWKRIVRVDVWIVMLQVTTTIRMDRTRIRTRVSRCLLYRVLTVSQCPLFDEQRSQMTIGTQILGTAQRTSEISSASIRM